MLHLVRYYKISKGIIEQSLFHDKVVYKLNGCVVKESDYVDFLLQPFKEVHFSKIRSNNESNSIL